MLTGAELRHTFVRMALALADGVEVLSSYCEGLEKTLETFVRTEEPGADVQREHVRARQRSEEDFFRAFVKWAPDVSRPVWIPKGEINDSTHVERIVALAPDLLVAYGCSLIQPPLLEAFKGRILNVHLGLSPYYRGSGTNFWALVNGEPEFVGATFMHMDSGVDTGAILHQIRARVLPGDGPHQIGNRLISDLVGTYVGLIRGFDLLESPLQSAPPESPRYYRRKDFTPESVLTLYRNFDEGLVEDYLRHRAEREARVPLVTQPVVHENGKLQGLARNA